MGTYIYFTDEQKYRARRGVRLAGQQVGTRKQRNALDWLHDRQAVLTLGKPPRKYIVRRLLPIECCRLQGYPDGWPDLICVAWTKASVTPENADPAVQFADDVEFSVLYPELSFKTKMADIPLAVQEMSFGNQIDDITPWIA